VPLLEQGHEATNVPLLTATLAWAYLELGAPGQAENHVEQAAGRARAANYRRLLVEALRVQALVRPRQGRWAEAEDALEEGNPWLEPCPTPTPKLGSCRYTGSLLSSKAREHRPGRTWRQG
jgi:hypothetical protein